MGKKNHNFWEFFYLVASDNPKANKKAVWLSCVRKYTLPVASTKPECFVSNKAKLCRSHLKNCSNFKAQYSVEEVLKILARSVPEDAKKKSGETDENNSESDEISTTITEISISNSSITSESILSSNKSTPSASPSTSNVNKQAFLDNYVIRQLSEKDQQHFENLVLRMIISKVFLLLLWKTKKQKTFLILLCQH